MPRWESTACRHHHSKNISELRSSAPFHVREEACGAWTNSPPIVVVPQLGLIYVENRRAASQTIREALQRFFHATTYSCWNLSGCRKRRQACSWGGRCTSACLSDAEAAPFFAFSFIRDPVEKFYSGLEVFMERNRRSQFNRGNSTDLRQRLLPVLQPNEMSPDGNWCRWLRDPHLWSSTFQLSARTAAPENGSSALLEYGYIGNVRTLSASFLEMLITANSSQTSANGRLAGISQERLARVQDFLSQTHRHNDTELLKAKIQAARDQQLDRAVAASYAQDMACFSGKFVSGS